MQKKKMLHYTIQLFRKD